MRRIPVHISDPAHGPSEVWFGLDHHGGRLALRQHRTSSMAATSRTGLRAFRSLASTVCRRPFSHTAPALAGPRDAGLPFDFDAVMGNVDSNFKSAGYSSIIPGSEFGNSIIREWEEDDRHKLTIYSTKHNTHLTFAKPNRDALISVSCGNIGFRKAGRGTYDAGYQLAAFVMSRIRDKGLLPQIQKLELIYRGFGPGREAVTKAILGSEGKQIRPLIVRLSDSTRLKFGGVRGKKPRRLG
ncbi:mitochondrial ribosomal protein-like protein subunit S18 [Boeremia exigua]|uniref:mitochondrial ribosomal protein-like protein subunit S18 n=1 Tax=Boeremia exigua TaxID=749465 RepID=UPI001E8D3C4E|nr:mitochondrial ribosomal protein-like protein subunit S18 [Boeremia exigua]KAH6615241.1 mitochondrial ribosomal protein-like protein subunit S18 [Boeremia exigua]